MAVSHVSNKPLDQIKSTASQVTSVGSEPSSSLEDSNPIKLPDRKYFLTGGPPPPTQNQNDDPLSNAADALKNGIGALRRARHDDQAGAISKAKEGVTNATKAAGGFLRVFKGSMGLDDDIIDIGEKAIKLGESLANLGINSADMVWSKSPAQNLANFKQLAGALLNANNDIVQLDSNLRAFATLNPQSLEAVKNLNESLTQMSEIYKELKKDGFDPALIDPRFGKFMDRIDQASGNFKDFISNYSDYTEKAKGLPQMGTAADMLDYAKSVFDLSGKHRLDRIDRNVAAKKAMEAWSEFKDNFNKITALEDLN